MSTRDVRIHIQTREHKKSHTLYSDPKYFNHPHLAFYGMSERITRGWFRLEQEDKDEDAVSRGGLRSAR